MERIVYGEGRQRLRKFTPSCNYDRIGSYRGLSVWMAKGFGVTHIEVCSEKDKDLGRLFGRETKSNLTRVMSIHLTKSRARLFKDSYEVSMVIIDSKYQGYGLAPKIYRYLMKKVGITLKAGNCQSYGGRSIWNELANYKDVEVVGSKSGYGVMDMESGDEREMSTGIDGVQCYDSGKFTAYAYYKGAGA